MRVVIFGTGGVGGYFGGRLAQAGEEVIFIARGAHLSAMQSHGLKVESLLGDFTIYPVQATDDPGQVGQADVVLVCVKAWQVPDAAVALQPMIGPDTVVIPLQNGVEAVDQLAAVLETPGKPFQHVAGGLCRISSLVAGPGYIRHVAIEPSIAFGALDGRPDWRLQQLLEAFRRAGVNAEIPVDIQAAIWMKFVFIAAISGVGAVTRAPVGIIRTMPETRQMLLQALEEIVTIARARQVALPSDAVQRTLAIIDGLPGGTLASMQRDIMAGTPSELEAQNGAVMRMGQTHEIPTPTHLFIYSSLLPVERKARRELDF